MMSYLEGDSLLKELEQSLDEEAYKDDDDDILIECSETEGEGITH
jgi:hypothetical protein